MPCRSRRRTRSQRAKRPRAMRILKRNPGRTYDAWDSARNARQARALARGYPRGVAKIVKTGPSRGKRRDVFPYTIYVKKAWITGDSWPPRRRR